MPDASPTSMTVTRQSNSSRVLLIGSLPPPYHGSTLYFQSLLNSRIRQEFDIIFLDTSDRRDLANVGTFDLMNVYLASRSIVQLAFLCLTRRPKLVYVPIAQNVPSFLRDGTFVIVSSFLSRAKIVVHLHGSHFRDFFENTNGFMRWFIKRSLKRVDMAIVLGNRLKRIFDGLVKDIEVVPNGIPTAYPASTKVAETHGNPLQIGYLGNLFKSKGVLDLLAAARSVLEKHPETRFRFAGAWWQQEPETKEQALRFIHENGLDGSVEFTGVVLNGDKEDFLASTDIFVLPTRYPTEGLPLVILEAMAHGCPVISTRDVGAIPEVVVDGVTGILVEKQNPQQLSEAIIKLIENPKLRESMGKAGRERFEKNYTMDINVENMIRVFHETLDGSR
jgi:glycosyltransferase involved in cell wall biosynthesis